MKHSISLFGLRSAFVFAAASTFPTLVGCSEDSNESSSNAMLQGSAGATNGAPTNGMGGGGSGGEGGSAGVASGGTSGAGSAGQPGAAGTSTAGAAGDGSEPAAPGVPDAGSGAAFTLTSPAFENNPGCGPDGDEPAACGLFDVDNTGLGDGADVSPAIDWTSAPTGTQSFAIAFHDLSNINGQSPFTHWVMWNIPATSSGLPPELPAGTEPGVPAANTRQVSFRGNGAFAGSGRCGNVYEFVLYALSVPQFDPPDTSSADAVQDAVEASSSVLDTATMRGRSNPAGPCD